LESAHCDVHRAIRNDRFTSTRDIALCLKCANRGHSPRKRRMCQVDPKEAFVANNGTPQIDLKRTYQTATLGRIRWADSFSPTERPGTAGRCREADLSRPRLQRHRLGDLAQLSVGQNLQARAQGRRGLRRDDRTIGRAWRATAPRAVRSVRSPSAKQ
jgi:hypothetical protein